MPEEFKILVMFEVSHVNIGTVFEGYKFYLKIGSLDSTFLARTVRFSQIYFEVFGEWATKLKDDFIRQGGPIESLLGYEIHCINGPGDERPIPGECLEIILGIVVTLFEVGAEELVIG